MNVSDFNSKNRAEMVDRIIKKKVLAESSWNIESFDTKEKIEEELKRLHDEKEKHLKNDDMPSFYFENIDNHIEELNNKMREFDCKCEEKIQESRLPSDPSVDPQFGVPSQKKYPLFDEQHVRSAIKLFGHVDPAYERELARAIIAKMKKYNIPYNSVGPDNRLYKYIPEKFRKEE